MQGGGAAFYVILSVSGTVQYRTVKILQTVTCYHGVALVTTLSTSAAKPLLTCVDLFACSMEVLNNLAIFIQGIFIDFATQISLINRSNVRWY